MLINVSEEQNISDSKNLLVIKECPTLKKIERLPKQTCVATNHITDHHKEKIEPQLCWFALGEQSIFRKDVINTYSKSW